MANRGKHLLEAFKTAGPGASPPPSSASAPRSASAPGGGGLSARPAASSSPYGAPTVISLNAPQLRLFGLVVLLLCVVTFLLGRLSVSRDAQAAESGASEKAAQNEAAARKEAAAQVAPNVSTPSQAAPTAQPAVAAPAPAGGQPVVDSQAREPAEQALLDRKNVYTIKLVHYSNTQANQRLAAQTAQYIRAQNLPAVVATDGAGLFILVGAAPRQVDLDAYLAQVKRLPGPPPLNRAGEFASAYLEKIDRVFKR